MAQDKTKYEEYVLLGGINSKASQYANGPHEFLDLVNVNFQKPGALSKRDGSTFYVGATVTGKVTGLHEYERLSGFSQIIATANTNAYSVTNSSWSSIKSGLTNNALFDFTTFVDRMFACNGSEFFKYDGTNTSNYSLPSGVSGWGVTAAVGGGLSGTIVTSYGYFNDRGFFGSASDGITIVLNGATFGSIQYYGLTIPAGFGISGMAFYRSLSSQTDLFRSFTVGATTMALDAGATALTNEPEPPYYYLTQAPKYLSIYNNQLMMSGFSTMLSTVVFSDIGEPEGTRPEYNFEVRTNDGDRITATTPYNGTLLIFKEKSFHRLSGDNPNNFTLSEVSDQYGCLSHRGVVVWNDLCWFLDRKGIIQYNSANISVVSNKIEPIFARMNIDAAKDNATAIHDRLKNQIKFSFPVDGSTSNNMTVVYDYVADAWTTENGYTPSIVKVMRGSLNRPSVFYGGTGTLKYMGSSFLSDSGAAITCLIKSRFLADMGNSVEKQFRRLFLDVVPVGASSAVSINFFQDYGASIVLSRTMYQAPFQSRIDFGIMAKSMAVEITNTSATYGFQVNGYTIEYRMQRRV